MAAGLAHLAADDAPNDDEQKALRAAMLLKGKTKIDEQLNPPARVSVKFETVNDAALVMLSKQPGIGAISALDSTRCTVKGFTALQKLPHLQRLVLNRSGVTDKSLAAIAGCKELRELVIPESTVTDAGLAVLPKLSRLEALDLSDAGKISDKGMTQIQMLVRLEKLFLNKTGITDKGLLELQPLEGLRSLSVGGTRVTATAAEKFAEEMPNLRVVRR
jgi:hypothetical protein